jgi:hypothetical protein
MIHLIKGKVLHLIIFGLLVIYVLSANTIYTTFFLKHGKPIPGKIELPPQTQSIQFAFLPIEEIRYDGQDYFSLHGYALHDTLKPGDYLIKIVLHSTTEDLVFPVDGTAVFYLLHKRPDYNESMNLAEFKMIFSKNVLKVDNYQIGILVEEKQGSRRYYQLTGNYIERTPNNLRFLTGQ